MCSNADWVINADAYDLGYNASGVVVLNHGNDSDPYQYPSPAQSGITPSTPETYWAGSLSSWGVDMVKQGYEVESLPYNGHITFGDNTNPQDLSNYKVFICDEPNIVFSSTAKDALIHFVQNGGGLFMISDHDQSDRNGDGWDSPHIWNDLMSNNTVLNNPFGMTFDYANLSQTTTNVANLPGDSCLHGPLGSVTSIKYSNGTSLTLNTADNNTVTGLIYTGGSSATGTTGVLVAKAYFGNGRVAALGDSSPPDDGTGDPNDNSLYMSYSGEASGNHRKLLVNTTIWLAGATGSPISGILSTGNDKIDVSLFPNPAKDEIQIAIPTVHSAFEIEITDISGRKISGSAFSNSPVRYDISGLSKGIYLAVVSFDGARVVKKFAVN